MKFIKILFFILPVLGEGLTVNSFSNNLPLCDSSTIIVKYKPGSRTFKLLRNQNFKSHSAKIKNSDIGFLPGRNENITFKPLKIDADESPLPGGIERIFILNTQQGNLRKLKESLAENNEIEYAEYDYFRYASGSERAVSPVFIPNDYYFSYQWSLKNTGQIVRGIRGIVGADINIEKAWDVTTGDTSLIIAVLDSGVPLYNYEFSNRLIQGYDFVNSDNAPIDDFWHGTLVTGIIGATGNNNNLISGINWNSKILPLKVLNSEGYGNLSLFALAIIYATDSHAKIINLSAGGTTYSRAEQDAITYAFNQGVIFVTCMMNKNNNEINYPAAFSNVIAVGATDNLDKRANPFSIGGGGSNYGGHIDFVAPGNSILGLNYESNSQNPIFEASGTSFSTAIVSGIISLMCSISKDLTFDQVYKLLKNNSKDQIGDSSEDKPGWDKYFGWGRVDAGSLIKYMAKNEVVNEIPVNFFLNSNYPNPFNISTAIEFGLPSDDYVLVEIYDILGRKVQTLLNNSKKAGVHKIFWDAIECGSGIYICKLTSSNFSASKKLILVK